MSNTFGHLFRITTWGESHGGGVGVVIDGCPPNLGISDQEIQMELDRRKPGQSRITTQRQESDKVEIQSGVFEGKTLGTPISLMVWNKDARPQDYDEMKTKIVESGSDGQEITISSVREIFGTSRKYTLAVLEYMDKLGITRRTGDSRYIR